MEDIWESEEEASEEEEEEGDSSDDAPPIREQQTTKRDSVSPQVVARAVAVEESRVELEKSSRGRIRKRRINPNDVDTSHTKKRKKTEPVTPQKPACSSVSETNASPASIGLSPFTGSQNSILNLNLLNKHGIQLRFHSPPSAATSQVAQPTLSNLTSENATLLAQLAAASSSSPSATTPQVLPASGQHVIKALLSSGSQRTNPAMMAQPKVMPQQYMTVTSSASQPLNIAATNPSSSSAPQHRPSYIVLPNANPIRQVSPVKMVKVPKSHGVSIANLTDGNTTLATASGPRFFHYNSLSELPPGLIQHILKTQDSRIKGQSKIVPAGNATAMEASTSDENALLLNLIKAGVLPAPATLPQGNMSSHVQTPSNTTSRPASDSAAHVSVDSSQDTKGSSDIVSSPVKLSSSSPVTLTTDFTKTGQVNPELLARLSASRESGAIATVNFSPQRAPKYASNVTVKALLETRAATTPRGPVKDITAALAEAEAAPINSMPKTLTYNVAVKPPETVVAKSSQRSKGDATDGIPNISSIGGQNQNTSHPIVLPDGAPKIMTLPVTVSQQFLQPQLFLGALPQSNTKSAPQGGLPQLCLQLRPAGADVAHQVAAPAAPVPQLRFQFEASQPAPSMRLTKPNVQMATASTIAEPAISKQMLHSSYSNPLQQTTVQMSSNFASAISVPNAQQPLSISSNAIMRPSGISLQANHANPGAYIGSSQHLGLMSSAVQPTTTIMRQQTAPLQTTRLTTAATCAVNLASGHRVALTRNSVPVQSTMAPQQLGSASLANVFTGVQASDIGDTGASSQLHASQRMITTASLPGMLAPQRPSTPQQVMVLPQGVVLTPQLLQQIAAVRGQLPGPMVLQYGKDGSAQVVRAPVPAASSGRVVAASSSAPMLHKSHSSAGQLANMAATTQAKLHAPRQTTPQLICLPPTPSVQVPRAPGVVTSGITQTQPGRLTMPTLRAPGLVAVPQSSMPIPRNPSPLSMFVSSGTPLRFSAQPAKLNVSISPPSVGQGIASGQGSVGISQSLSNKSASGHVAAHVGASLEQAAFGRMSSHSGQRIGISSDPIIPSLSRTSGLPVAAASPRAAESSHDLTMPANLPGYVIHTADVTLNNLTAQVSQHDNVPAVRNRATSPDTQWTNQLTHSKFTTLQPFVLTRAAASRPFVQQVSPAKAVVPPSVNQPGTVVRLIRMPSPVKKGNSTTKHHAQQKNATRLPFVADATKAVQSPAKLVLYNVGGQLVTAQGVPVSLPISLPHGITTTRMSIPGPVRQLCVGGENASFHKPQMLLSTEGGSGIVRPPKGQPHPVTTIRHVQQQSNVVKLSESSVTHSRSHASRSDPVSIEQHISSDQTQVHLRHVTAAHGAPSSVPNSPMRSGNSNVTSKTMAHTHVSSKGTLKDSTCDADRQENRVSEATGGMVGGMVGGATGLPSCGETGLGLLSQAAALQQAFNSTDVPLDESSSLPSSS